MMRLAWLTTGLVIGAVAGSGMTAFATKPVVPLRPVEITLHRFDIKPGQRAKFEEWIAFLKASHRAAVATLTRERTYFEAMFTAPDEPDRLYWLTVNGAGGAPVDNSPDPLDLKHIEYMDAVLVKGSHARLVTRNVLSPDFVVRAIRTQQRDVER